MNIRTVSLKGGPMDGRKTIASHLTAIMANHVYVWNGEEDGDTFVPVSTVLLAIPIEQRIKEYEMLKAAVGGSEIDMAAVKRMTDEIPVFRINAWNECIRYEIEIDGIPDPYREAEMEVATPRKLRD